MTADLPTDFWSGWIIVLTVVSLGVLIWFILSLYFGKSEDHPSPVWDETLTEGEHPAPMWWFWYMLAALVFTVVYLMLYPGLGAYAGMMEWSQGGEIAESTERFDATFADARDTVLVSPLETLHTDAAAMASANRVFARNCVPCHGPGGQGQADAFPNLMDGDWQWGGDPAQVEQSIRTGRQAIMVGWAAVLGDGLDDVVDHVFSLSGQAEASENGATLYTQFCAACHAPGGEGVAVLGGPNLTDDVWLYGGSREAVTESIANGRNGVMPPFGERLDDVQVKLLVALLTAPQAD